MAEVPISNIYETQKTILASSNNNFQIEHEIDLRIKKIIKIFNYQNKIFISSQKGTTYIF